MLLFKSKAKVYTKLLSNGVKIDIFDEEVLKFWVKKINCTEDALVDAVSRVGTSSIKVEEYFSKN